MSLYRCCRCRWHCLAVRDRTRGQAGQPVAVSCSCVPVSNCPAKCTGCAPPPLSPPLSLCLSTNRAMMKAMYKVFDLYSVFVITCSSFCSSFSFSFFFCCVPRGACGTLLCPFSASCLLLLAPCLPPSSSSALSVLFCSVSFVQFSSVWFRLSLSSALCKSD